MHSLSRFFYKKNIQKPEKKNFFFYKHNLSWGADAIVTLNEVINAWTFVAIS